MPANGQLQYIGVNSETCIITISLSFSASITNHVYKIQINKNGVVVTNSITQVKLVVASNIYTVAFSKVIQLVTNDFLQIFISDTSGTSSLTFNSLNLAAMACRQ